MITAADRECPACGAAPGRPCLDTKGRVARAIHAARVRGTERIRDERKRSTASEQLVENQP